MFTYWTSWPENTAVIKKNLKMLKIYAYFHLHASCTCSNNNHAKEACFASDLSSLPMRNQYRLARDVFHTFATHAGPVYDITDIDCWSQNGCTHSRSYVTSLPIRSQNRLAHDISHFCHACWPSLWHHWYRRLVTKSLHTQSYLCDF